MSQTLPRRRFPWLASLLALATCLATLAPTRGEGDAAGESLFRQLDASGDGVLTLGEATVGSRSFLERIFKAAGKGPGDRVSREEFLAAHQQLRGKSGGATAKPVAPTDSSATAGEEPPPGIKFIDANGDEAISRAEWSRFTQTFARLDTDKDNALSAAELEATGGAAELLMKLADANGDGKIARVEWAKLVQSFARLDTNHDSNLAESELQAAANSAVAAASGTAILSGSGKGASNSGPTLWRGSIEGRGDIELLINGNHIAGRELGRGGGGQSLGAGTFTMTGDGKSGNMDAVYTEGDRSGQTCLGIYRIEGDSLTWCVNNRGGRPESFAAAGRGNWLLTLKRVDDRTR